MFRGQWALVTGAASGIGRATAELLAERGAKLVLVDCDETRLSVFAEELGKSGHEVRARVVDVSDREAMRLLGAWLDEQVGPLALLVNNAGILRVGRFDATSLDDFDRLIDVNLRGVVHGVKFLAPAMRRNGRGVIVNVASASGIVGFSPLTAYSTSKFAVVGLSAALGGDLAAEGVHVCCVCPGLVRTSIVESCPLPTEVRPGTEAALSKYGMPVERVAQAIVRGAERRKPLVHVGGQALVLSWLARLAPGRASRWVAYLSRRWGQRLPA